MRHLVNILDPPDGEAIVLMPLTRVLCESPTQIGKLTIFPPGYLEVDPSGCTSVTRNDLVRLPSQLTGFSFELFNSFSAVGFCAEISCQSIQQHDHDADITLLSQLSNIAEKSFDLLRLDYCRLDLPATLPGPIGLWDISTPYLGASIYFPDENAFCDLSGAAASYGVIVSGIGLDLDACQIRTPPSEADGKVGAIAAHALALLSDAMHARNDTAKFVRCMTLLEFVGSPDGFKKWVKLKGEIACHVARNKSDYLKAIEELRLFTSLENEDGKQMGYRTLVVHHGKFLEDILPKRDDRQVLFRRLQKFSHAVITDMIRNAHMSWEDFLALRAEKKLSLGVT